MVALDRVPGGPFVQILVRNHSLVYQLVRRDFELRYVGSVAGWLWGLIHPLVLLGVYTFVFVYAFGIKLPEGEVTDNYPLFLFAGMLPWLLFSESLQRSASSLPEYANLIKKSIFPSEVVPLTILLSNLISHFLGLFLLIVGTAIWMQQVSWTMIVLPVYLALLGLLTLGLSWIAAGLHVYIRDTAQVLTVALTAWFWLTPIFLYESVLRDNFGGKLGFLLLINPMVYVVRAYRSSVLGNELPSGADLAAMAAFAVVTFIAGGFFFRYAKRGFADVL
jgi:ABC-type polysaccharide/polyol phosphate export permease